MSQNVGNLDVGDVIQTPVSGSQELGIVTARQPRMTPPHYLDHDKIDVVLYPGMGAEQDGMEIKGMVVDAQTRRVVPPPTFRERLEAMATHGDLKPRSLMALECLRRREVGPAIAVAPDMGDGPERP